MRGPHPKSPVLLDRHMGSGKEFLRPALILQRHLKVCRCRDLGCVKDLGQVLVVDHAAAVAAVR